MTKQSIDWRNGATRADRAEVARCDGEIRAHSDEAAAWSQDRKRIIARCYQVARRKAARAAKRGK